MKKLVALLISILTLISGTLPAKLGLPVIPKGQNLDMSKFELTWSDEFNGTELDKNKWGTEWWVTQRNGGFWHDDMVNVGDGHLTISCDYKEEALSNPYYDKWHDTINFKEFKPGYYSACVTTNGKFEQKYGYFEARCILPAGFGMWSAFWMMNEGVYNVDGSGNDGTEVDIFESECYKTHPFFCDQIATNLHLDGYGEGHKKYHVGNYYIENDPYKEFNTYGVEWNEDEYIFYINGVETGRTNFGGVSDNPEYLLLSVEVAGSNGVPGADWYGTGKIEKTPKENWPCKFVVDYVRCYQYKDILAKLDAKKG